jgi:hypothetical protein
MMATDYPERLRRVAFYDREKNTTLIFLTNNFELTADQVATFFSTKCLSVYKIFRDTQFSFFYKKKRRSFILLFSG